MSKIQKMLKIPDETSHVCFAFDNHAISSKDEKSQSLPTPTPPNPVKTPKLPTTNTPNQMPQKQCAMPKPNQQR
jgi:hypothetical protein